VEKVYIILQLIYSQNGIPNFLIISQVL